MKLKKPAGVAALALVSVLALGACGSEDSGSASGWKPGDGGQSTAVDPGEEAPGTGDPEASGSAESDPEETTEDPGTELEAPAEGESVAAEDFMGLMKSAYENVDTARVRTVTTTGGMEMVVEGVADYSSTPPKALMKMTGADEGGGSMEMRMVDGKMYMSLGKASGGKFYVLDTGDLGAGGGEMSQLEDMTDPSKAFEMFAAGIESVTFVGSEDVDGQDTDHYRLTIDLSKVPQMAELSTGAGGDFEPMTMDTWFDGEGRPVVSETTMTFMDIETSSRTELSDFGVEVEVEAPPASQVTEYPGS